MSIGAGCNHAGRVRDGGNDSAVLKSLPFGSFQGRQNIVLDNSQ